MQLAIKSLDHSVLFLPFYPRKCKCSLRLISHIILMHYVVLVILSHYSTLTLIPWSSLSININRGWLFKADWIVCLSWFSIYRSVSVCVNDPQLANYSTNDHTYVICDAQSQYSITLSSPNMNYFCLRVRGNRTLLSKMFCGCTDSILCLYQICNLSKHACLGFKSKRV